jgi:RimJ/RimL family protein N-acetyltransferase
MREPDKRPELRSERLCLRPFQASDALRLEELINDREIAANTRTIEYPYPAGAAIKWIEAHPDLWTEGKGAIFAICQLDGALMGAIGLEIDPENHNAELGFWIGQDFRNCGYTSEAARMIIEFGFRDLALQKIYASHLARNPASGRVMQKVGMQQEGYFRKHFRKWGVFEDLVYFGILPSDFTG